MNVKINISFDHRSLLAVPVTRVVRQCILATLQEEKVPVPCEINVLLTDDGGIHAINLATRQVDRPTDVLSFPMFQLTPGRLPRDWSNYLDPETGLCPLGDMAISLERAKSPGRRIWPFSPPGGGISHHPLHAASAGLRPPGRGT